MKSYPEIVKTDKSRSAQEALDSAEIFESLMSLLQWWENRASRDYVIYPSMHNKLVQKRK